jgi:hypothetical protein
VHSGLFGGAAPDALVGLVRILAALHDERGGTAVPGQYETEWIGEGALASAAGRGRPAGEIGCGGSIPLVAALSRTWPRADVVLWGVQEMVRARIHGCDESVDPAELERMVVAQARLLSVLGGRG